MFFVRFMCVFVFKCGIVSHVFYKIAVHFDSDLKCNYNIIAQRVNVLRSEFIMITALDTDQFTIAVLL